MLQNFFLLFSLAGNPDSRGLLLTLLARVGLQKCLSSVFGTCVTRLPGCEAMYFSVLSFPGRQKLASSPVELEMV